jgi:hypothetical protein
MLSIEFFLLLSQNLLIDSKQPPRFTSKHFRNIDPHLFCHYALKEEVMDGLFFAAEQALAIINRFSFPNIIPG